MLLFSPLNDPSDNESIAGPPIARKHNKVRRLGGDSPKDSDKVKKKNYGIDFSKCRGHVTEEEKKKGTIKKGDGRDETMKERLCMVLRQMVVDWKNAKDDFDEFKNQWKLGEIRKNLLKQIRCVSLSNIIVIGRLR